MITPIAITPGEPAGIGPEILLRLAQQKLPRPAVAVASIDLLKQRARECDLDLQIYQFKKEAEYTKHTPGSLPVLDIELKESVQCGELNPANSGYVLKTLQVATECCLQGVFHALTTGPVHKGVINDAGYTFSGHTEYLGQLSNDYPVMMLVASKLRVALVTTHLPLKEVSQAISKQRLKQVILVLHRDLTSRFRISQPRIAVTGLNPHAGENGYLGREEIDVIQPVLKELRASGISLGGPLPADTVFTPSQLNQYDVVLTMYHDQGLPVLKHLGFGSAVNVTLGLPIIRTSVDHGTALELAGTGKAEIDSLIAAFEMAASLS